LAILKDKLAHEWRQRLEQALAARFDQVECLVVVARRAAIGIGDVDVGAVASVMATMRPDRSFSLLNISGAQLALAPADMPR
jgi:hypothetical protein